ncbi:MAG: U32 family peptidase [Fibrobacter sp.]|nr:U32 family peptidase [Fibrobacter sp.]
MSSSIKRILPELLAPAGSFAIAEAAFDHGADAIYIGLEQFNLRAHSPNFTAGDIPELMSMAEKRGKRVYAALNILPDDKKLCGIRDLLLQLKKAGSVPHALIISDPGVLLACREILPGLHLHLSTQTGSFNSQALRFWKEQGITRAVLPRELSLDQISRINSCGVIETEAFIHGAMCVSISGRCLLGAYIDQRHPNFGDCAQPCRLRYRIAPVKVGTGEVGEWLDAEENEEGVYLLNSKDLCTIEILPQILGTGLSSLKIEGRNKSIHYVSTVIKVYREALDTISNGLPYTVKPEWKSELEKVEHRPYTTGFYAGETMLQEVFSSKASSGSRVMGIVKGLLQGGDPVIDVKNSFSAGEKLEVLPVKQSSAPFEITFTSLCDLSGNAVSYVPSSRLVTGKTDKKLRAGDMLRKLSKPGEETAV